jgi:S-adenosylmethionine hydrolase
VIFVFTDFGIEWPYLGQMRAVLHRLAPGVPVVDLMADAPAFAPEPAGHLLAARASLTHPRDVVLAVVDPGVGTAREPVAVEADGRWLVGPDNGLLEPLVRRSAEGSSHRIVWRPPTLSSSFHGRDLFAPIAARMALGLRSGLEPWPLTRFPEWPDELPAILYVDHYGNAMTGLRAASLDERTILEVGGRRLARAGTFGEVGRGELFWYANSIGLAEIAANAASAAHLLGVAPGDRVAVA